MRQLRIALTISGAIALGAYEGGALAALLLAAQERCKGVREGEEAPVRIDAIGCASAGAMTGVLAARTLLQGYDPIAMMYRTWVQAANVWTMLTANPHTLLSLAKLERIVTQLLQPPTLPAQQSAPREKPYYQDKLDIVISLACLQGLDYQIRRLSDATHIDATTYVDWKRFTVHHAEGDALSAYIGGAQARTATDPAPIDPKYTSLVAFAMASGANEFGFAPALLNRERDKRVYQRNGIAHPYEWLWYTDGGTLDNEPLGRTLDISDQIDGKTKQGDDYRRLHLLIHPHPDSPQQAGDWTNPARQPDWTATLAHALQLLRSQHLYDDLRRMEKTNTHIAWTDRLEERLAALLDELEQHDPDIYARWRIELNSLEQGIRQEKHGLRAAPDGEPAAGAGGEAAATERPANAALVHWLVREASGIGERQRVRAEVISPLLLLKGNPTTGVDQLLAGEILSSFGGFLDKRLRQSDFQLGFLSVMQWMRDIQQREAHAHPHPSAGERDEVYEVTLGEFVAAGLPAVEAQADKLVARMHELDYLALPGWRRPFARKPSAQPEDRVASARPKPSAPAERPPMALLYKTQGPKTLINLPAAWVMVPLLALKVLVMFLYERILWSFPERLAALFRRSSRPPATPAPK